MLVWFMHGASVRNPGYADVIRSRLVDGCSDRIVTPPEFYACYWGDVLETSAQMWDWVEQDLAAFRWDNPMIEVEDVFHFRSRREQLISGFFNDIFHYLNSAEGKNLRKTIAVQFLSFLADHPFEEDLHIVAHSLGSVILWDILFSETFAANDPAFYVRDRLKGLTAAGPGRKVTIRSVTTLGSPLLFFNRIFGIDGRSLQTLANRYTGNPLRWINVINASDIFAYPLRSSLELDDSTIVFKDLYLGERNFLKRSVGDVAMAFSLVTAHSSYWKSQRVANLALANILGEMGTLEMTPPILEMGETD